MIGVTEAGDIINEHVKNWGTESIPLEQAIDRILAQDVYTDRDMPPYDRVSMDGIAISFETFQSGSRNYKIEGVSAAGTPQAILHDNAKCIEVMTGSVMPIGADVVVRYEDITIENGSATINIDSVNQHQNIHPKGRNEKAGAQIIKKGQKISSPLINGAATFGLDNIEVYKLPKVAVISTGDELIPISGTPLPHQIRQSNNYMIQSAVKHKGIRADLHHLADNQEKIRTSFSHILSNYDVVILSGGVSMGKFDFIPSMLSEAGVNCHFHKVTQRPGKPLWFGTKEEGPVVFGLPGNPASTCVCLHRYVLPYLEKCLAGNYEMKKAVLATDIHFGKPLTYYALVTISEKDGQRYAHPSLGDGSGDLANLTQVHGCVQLEKQRDDHPAGMIVPFYPFL